ncbi:MAG: hypothetical protein EOO40_03110 [Deltaproteobacteria bacterium]|nr:MAG: hypothetical protein EOO40_03110 [Deltaproteobacteria bacterium]
MNKVLMVSSGAADAPTSRREILQDRVARDEAALRQAFSQFGEAVQTRTNVRQRINQRPYAWLAGCLLVGLWWGQRAGSR